MSTPLEVCQDSSKSSYFNLFNRLFLPCVPVRLLTGSTLVFLLFFRNVRTRKIPIIHLLGYRNGVVAFFSLAFHEDDHSQSRMLIRRERNEPAVCFFIAAELGSARFSRHGYRERLQRLRRTQGIHNCCSHTFAYNTQNIRADKIFPQYHWSDRGHLATRGTYLRCESGRIERSAIGNSRYSIQNLQRRRCHKSLTDSRIIIVTDIPTVSKLLLLPLWIRDKSICLSRHINIVFASITEEVFIFFHPLHTQALNTTITAADGIKEN